jgi:hypothetical protein
MSPNFIRVQKIVGMLNTYIQRERIVGKRWVRRGYQILMSRLV